MRSASLSLCLVAALISPLAAHAASLDLITLTSTSNSNDVYTFEVPAAGASDGQNSYSFWFNDVPATSTLFGPSTIDQVRIYDSDAEGGIAVAIYPEIDLIGPVLYGGTLTNPTFTIGNSGILTNVGSGPNFAFAISAAPTTPSPTPEPAPALLLGTGLVALCSFALWRGRSRLLA